MFPRHRAQRGPRRLSESFGTRDSRKRRRSCGREVVFSREQFAFLSRLVQLESHLLSHPLEITFMPDHGLERYRSALLLLARAQLARHQQLGLEASDLVQQTFAEACRDVDQFRGGTDAERFAW